MSVGAILTLGYGSFGGIGKIVTLGFAPGAPVVPPPAATDAQLYIVLSRGRNGLRTQRKRLSPKDPEETVVVTFDYTLDLAVAETLSAPLVTAEVMVGEDPAPAAIILGAASVDGPRVHQFVTSGVAGVNYRLQCKAATSLSQELALAGVLPVRES